MPPRPCSSCARKVCTTRGCGSLCSPPFPFCPGAGDGNHHRLGRGCPPVTFKPLVTWFVHLAACTAIGLLIAAWATYMDAVLNPYGRTADPGPFVHRWLEWFYNGIFSTIVLYGAILAVSSVLESRSRLAYQQTETARLNEQLSRAPWMPCGARSSLTFFSTLSMPSPGWYGKKGTMPPR